MIIKTIKEIDKKKFKDLLKKTVNPYGGGGASKKTYQIIKKLNLENSLSNKFFDLDYEKKTYFVLKERRHNFSKMSSYKSFCNLIVNTSVSCI